ncbi:unnamed protein product [Notodromas monacha]|uniref:CBM21 domain-containing protein n=1 Tax=Notodromas monacha TaxID=399045 RepID=A0A7R9BIJ5_9CRUS|nr:unnamed protein product [Notodromas monacha]CAG0914577.1 unnamed protein product [Notodromas monacha]
MNDSCSENGDSFDLPSPDQPPKSTSGPQHSEFGPGRAAASLEIHLRGSPEREPRAVSWTVACSLTSLLGMNCKSRAEAFARSLQSKLRHLGSSGSQEEEEEDDGGAGENGAETEQDPENRPVSAPEPSPEPSKLPCAGGCPVTLGLAKDTGRLLFVRREGGRAAPEGEPNGRAIDLSFAQSPPDSDAGYYDFDIGSPMSPEDSCSQQPLINRRDDLLRQTGDDDVDVEKDDDDGRKSGSEGGESGCVFSTPDVDGRQQELSLVDAASDETTTSDSSVSQYFDVSEFWCQTAKLTKSNVYDAYNSLDTVPTPCQTPSPPILVVVVDPPPRRTARQCQLSDASETSPAQLRTFEELCRRSLEKEHHEKKHKSEAAEEREKRLRRSSSLKSGKTPPGTPGRKKIVRFADVMGLDLAEVRSFLDEIPNVPKSAYNDLDAAVCSTNDTLSYTSVVSPGDALGVAALPGNMAAAAAHPPTFILLPLFQQPGAVYGFLDRVRDHEVVLERAVEREMAIDGVVRVHNIAYHKSVFIRYTVDEWITSRDLHASYCECSCDGFSDKFTFTIYAHWMREGQRVQFAACFQANGQQYWDNNYGNNYIFQCYNGPGATAPTSLSTDGDNWRHLAHF